jgi:uncharacterized repeat protein (TIGR03803 family)
MNLVQLKRKSTMTDQQALRRFASVFTLFTALALFVQAASAQTETVLYSFCPTGGWCAGGAGPESVIADSAGNLYGITVRGGTGVGGIAFKITPSGQESLLYDFTREPYNGWQPEGPLILDKQGNLYGTTSNGGTNSIHFRIGDGTAFKLSPDGTETTLYNFGAYKTDGAQPGAGLVMDARGNFYGTTFWGGTNLYGTVFRLTPDGVETILHNFAYGSTDGGNPTASLIMDSSGNLYGTTEVGGSGGGGTVFEITAGGSYSILHNFTGGLSDGVGPLASLTLDSRGNLYGATYGGGAYHGAYFGGTVFKLSPGSNGSWNETILYSFGQQTGSCVNPWSNVLFDAKGNLYGTASYGGTWGGGCAYELSPAGKLTLLHAFGEGNDAAFPSGAIMFYRGSLYGAAGGGAYAEGTVFKITP